MPTPLIDRKICQWSAVAGGLLAGFAWSGCTSQASVPLAPIVSTAWSPVAEPVAPADAWRLAEAYATGHPGSEVMVGSGDSMLPLYRDHTVLVVQAVAMSRLQSGMTVVFTGDRGRPVAHTLVERTPRGWRAIGVGNPEPDRTRVRYDNLIGVVVKAYAPTGRATLLAAAAPVPRLESMQPKLGAPALAAFAAPAADL